MSGSPEAPKPNPDLEQLLGRKPEQFGAGYLVINIYFEDLLGKEDPPGKKVLTIIASNEMLTTRIDSEDQALGLAIGYDEITEGLEAPFEWKVFTFKTRGEFIDIVEPLIQEMEGRKDWEIENFCLDLEELKTLQ